MDLKTALELEEKFYQGRVHCDEKLKRIVAEEFREFASAGKIFSSEDIIKRPMPQDALESIDIKTVVL